MVLSSRRDSLAVLRFISPNWRDLDSQHVSVERLRTLLYNLDFRNEWFLKAARRITSENRVEINGTI